MTTWEEARHFLYIVVAAGTLLTVLAVCVYVRHCRLPAVAQALCVFLPLSPALTVAMLNYVWGGGWAIQHGTLLLFAPATVCLVSGGLALARGLRRDSAGYTWAGALGLLVGVLLEVFLLKLISMRGMWGTALSHL